MKKILIFTILAVIFGGNVAFAQNTTSATAVTRDALDYRLMEPLPFITKGSITTRPGVGGTTITEAYTDLPTYVQGMYRLALVLGTVLAIFMIIVGGFKYVTSVIPNVKLDGKTDIQNALIGLAWLFGSILLIEIINPQLSKFTENIIPSLAIQRVYLNTTGMSIAQHDQSIGRINTQISELERARDAAPNDADRAGFQAQINGLYGQRGRLQITYTLKSSLDQYGNSLWANTNSGAFNGDAARNAYINQNTLSRVRDENNEIADRNNLPELSTLSEQAYEINYEVADYMADIRSYVNFEDRSTTEAIINQRMDARTVQQLAHAQTIEDTTLRSVYINQITTFRSEASSHIAASAWAVEHSGETLGGM